MAYISKKIKDVFPDLAIMKTSENNSLFSGRNLPSFVRDYILRRFTDASGVVDRGELHAYLDSKMPADYNSIKSRLLAGEKVNMTTRFITRNDIATGRTQFFIPDAQIQSDAYVSSSLMDNYREELADGEKWGNITLDYVGPEGKKRGYINMVKFKSFEPYNVDVDYFLTARENFTTEEWIDFLVAAMEYNPEKFDNIGQKQELISRLLVLVEPRLNMIELGPKGTGKSYVFNNLSKHAWIISGGKISRAKLFYNKSTRQFGIMKYYDAVAIDEISTFGFVDADEMQSIFKGYLEAGNATVDNVKFLSDCGIVLMGNIPLDSSKQPLSKEYYRSLPDMLHESATLDRFHGFIEGWRLPRLEAGTILQGWSLDVEYISVIFHSLRSRSEYASVFNELVCYDSACDLRDLKAVQRLATAYHKLLFPNVTNLSALSEEELTDFRLQYQQYCLAPSVYRRSIIRQQCHFIDKEFKAEMPNFNINF